MVRDRGKKGKHGDTDRAIMLLVILRGESLPDGVQKKIIYEGIEKNTGIDREGVKRRIKELTRNPDIEGILEETIRGGRSYFRVNVSNLYDLSRLYVFLMPALEASQAISSSIREYFDRHMNAFFTDFVDYFRLWNPFDHEWGMPPAFQDEPRLVLPGEEVPDLSVPEDAEEVYIQADGQIVSEKIAGAYKAYRKAFVFHPEYYPDYGTEKIKWLLSQAIQGEGYSFISPNLIDLLPAVKEVHEYFTKMENFHKDYVPPEMNFDEYPDECGVDLYALGNDVVEAAIFSFIEKLHELSEFMELVAARAVGLLPRRHELSKLILEWKIEKVKTLDDVIHGLSELSLELGDYLGTLEHMSYNPYIRMIRHGNTTTWAFNRLYEADAEERDSDDDGSNSPIDAANEAVKKDPYAWMLASGSDNHGTTLKRHAGKVSGEDVSIDEI